MLLLQIALTIAAWRNGWRMRALIPIAAALTVGFLAGGALGASGGSLETAAPLFILGDVVCLGVLIAMARRAPAGVLAAETAGIPSLRETAPDTSSPYAEPESIVTASGR